MAGNNLLNVTLVGDTELSAKFRTMPAAVQAALTRKVTSLAIMLHSYVITQKLSGQVLNHRSGKLWQSIHDKVTSTQSSVYGFVFSSGDIKYAGIHEYGGRTPAHIIEPKNAKALCFMMGSKQVFAKIVHHPGSVMPERSFLRSSLKDNADLIKQGMRDAVMEAMQQ